MRLPSRGEPMREAVHQVNLRADREGRARRSLFHNLDQPLG